MVNAFLTPIIWLIQWVYRNGTRIVGWGSLGVIMSCLPSALSVINGLVEQIPYLEFDLGPYMIYADYAQAFVDVNYLGYLTASFLTLLLVLFFGRTVLKCIPFFG